MAGAAMPTAARGKRQRGTTKSLCLQSLDCRTRGPYRSKRGGLEHAGTHTRARARRAQLWACRAIRPACIESRATLVHASVHGSRIAVSAPSHHSTRFLCLEPEQSCPCRSLWTPAGRLAVPSCTGRCMRGLLGSLRSAWPRQDLEACCSRRCHSRNHSQSSLSSTRLDS